LNKELYFNCFFKNTINECFCATLEVLDPEPVKHSTTIAYLYSFDNKTTLTIRRFQNTGYKSFLHKHFPDINDWLITIDVQLIDNAMSKTEIFSAMSTLEVT